MKEVLVIGLDGATWKVALPLVKAGKMPNLARLMEKGAWGDLQSTFPAHSGPAWATAVTGVDPGKHGIYDFIKRDAGSYQSRIVRTEDIKSPALWEIICSRGMRVGFINLPIMYPPPKVKGFAISGTTAPRTERRYTYPEELAGEIRRKFKRYWVEPAAAVSMNNPKLFVQEAMRSERRIFEVARHLMQTRKWNLFWVVFVGPDRLQHRFWKHHDKKHPWHEDGNEFEKVIENYYCEADGFIGKLAEEAGEETNVIVMSDHGFGPVWGQLNIATWLEREGLYKRKKSSTLAQGILSKSGAFGIMRRIYLGLRKRGWIDESRIPKLLRRFVPAGERVHDLEANTDWKKTAAFPDGKGRITINDGRFQGGCIGEKEKEAVSKRIMRGLLSLRDSSGRRAVKKVLTREEAFKGAAVTDLPDLFVFTEEGYLDGSFGSEVLGKPLRVGFEHNGGHRPEGIIAAAGPDFAPRKRLKGARIADITPTVLFLLGIQPDKGMDGKILKQALTQKATEKKAARAAGVYRKSAKKARLNRADEEIVKERLRGLGYLD